MVKRRQPEGDTQALFPRPRPASWNVARETIGDGIFERRVGFLEFQGGEVKSDFGFRMLYVMLYVSAIRLTFPIRTAC